jgi:hypothetical protein
MRVRSARNITYAMANSTVAIVFRNIAEDENQRDMSEKAAENSPGVWGALQGLSGDRPDDPSK